MPLLWQYLISNFLKITIACVFAFVAVLLTMRLDEIAHFAALGAPVSCIALFAFHQIPYILPIALPLSCLIASLLLVQRLSNTQELTALRASGFSLRDIFASIWLTGAFLALANFWITSEIATQSHLGNNLLKSELRAINPLLLLHNKHLMRHKGFFFEALGASRVGDSSTDVVLAFPSRKGLCIHLMLARRLSAQPEIFIGEGVTLINAIGGAQEEDFDQLLIENMKKTLTRVDDFSDTLQKKVWTVHNDYLQMPLLIARLVVQQKLLKSAQQNGEPQETIQPLKMQIERSYSEIVKRLSVALAVFSFTFMGTAFGIGIGRKRKFTTLYLAIALSALYLMAFFAAKGNDHHLWLAASLYLLPHLVIISASIIVLRRAANGLE